MKSRCLLGNISYRAWYMWRRNVDVSLVTWKTNVLPPLLEPVMYILAFGVGLGAYVQKITLGGNTYDYLTFLAPGMVAVGIPARIVPGRSTRAAHDETGTAPPDPTAAEAQP